MPVTWQNVRHWAFRHLRRLVLFDIQGAMKSEQFKLMAAEAEG